MNSGLRQSTRQNTVANWVASSGESQMYSEGFYLSLLVLLDWYWFLYTHGVPLADFYNSLWNNHSEAYYQLPLFAIVLGFLLASSNY